MSEKEQQIGTSRETALRKRFYFVIIAAIAVALAYMAFTYERQSREEFEVSGKIRSIAALPLENLASDPDQAFFVNGIHEALITGLSKVSALHVISWDSARRYRNSGKAIPDIARELGVDAVVEGSVLIVGGMIRLSVRLFDGRTGRQLWSDNFNSELGNILTIYALVTQEIVKQVGITLTPEEEAGFVVLRPVSQEVYELYLKGRYMCDKWSPQELQLGINLMQHAVNLDRLYAPSYAGLARCLQYSAFFGYVLPQEVFLRARTTAAMAVLLDDNLAEAHVALAGILYYLDFDIDAAEKELTRALELDPVYLPALVHMSWLLGETGRFDEARTLTLRAIQLDPLNTAIHQAMGELYYLHGDFNSSISAFKKGLELDRNDASLHQYLSWPHEQLGQYESAIALNKSAVELSQRAPIYLSGLGYSYGVAGMRENALQILEELQQAKNPSSYDLALVHLGLGNLEQAVDLLEMAFDSKDSYLIYIIQDSKFDPLRENERFIKLLNQLKNPAQRPVRRQSSG